MPIIIAASLDCGSSRWERDKYELAATPSLRPPSGLYGIGISKSLQILRARKSKTSRWRGIVDDFLARRL